MPKKIKPIKEEIFNNKGMCFSLAGSDHFLKKFNPAIIADVNPEAFIYVSDGKKLTNIRVKRRKGHESKGSTICDYKGSGKYNLLLGNPVHASIMYAVYVDVVLISKRRYLKFQLNENTFFYYHQKNTIGTFNDLEIIR